MLSFKRAKVTVIGDAIQDVYIHGRCDRISPEAPVPVFVEETVDYRHGGSGNVKANLLALGAKVSFSSGNPSTKIRYLCGGHQLLRVDKDNKTEHSAEELEQSVEWYGKVLVISDYGKGFVVHPELVIQEAKRRDMTVLVDPKGTDWDKYRGCDYIVPNQHERQHVDIGATVIQKLGKGGIEVNGRHFPSVTRQVADVTGAGDTVIATLACCLSVGMDLYEAVNAANHAAGVVCGKIGTSTCSIDELNRSLRENRAC